MSVTHGAEVLWADGTSVGRRCCRCNSTVSVLHAHNTQRVRSYMPPCLILRPDYGLIPCITHAPSRVHPITCILSSRPISP